MSRKCASRYRRVGSTCELDYPIKQQKDKFENLRPLEPAGIQNRQKKRAARFQGASTIQGTKNTEIQVSVAEPQETMKLKAEEPIILHKTPMQNLESHPQPPIIQQPNQIDQQSEQYKLRPEIPEQSQKHKSESDESRGQENKVNATENFKNQEKEELKIGLNSYENNKCERSVKNTDSEIGTNEIQSLKRSIRAQPAEQHNKKLSKGLGKNKKIEKRRTTNKKHRKNQGQDALSSKVFSSISAMFS